MLSSKVRLLGYSASVFINPIVSLEYREIVKAPDISPAT